MSCNVNRNEVNTVPYTHAKESTTKHACPGEQHLNLYTEKQHSPADLLPFYCNNTLDPQNQESKSATENANPPVADATENQVPAGPHIQSTCRSSMTMHSKGDDSRHNTDSNLAEVLHVVRPNEPP